MAEQEHTPGPWTTHWNTGSGDYHWIKEADDQDQFPVIAMVSVCAPTDGDMEMQGTASARLISRAWALPMLVAALEEIAKGTGPFSRDPLLHAANTIESMKETARAALAAVQDDTKGQG